MTCPGSVESCSANKVQDGAPHICGAGDFVGNAVAAWQRGRRHRPRCPNVLIILVDDLKPALGKTPSVCGRNLSFQAGKMENLRPPSSRARFGLWLDPYLGFARLEGLSQAYFCRGRVSIILRQLGKVSIHMHRFLWVVEGETVWDQSLGKGGVGEHLPANRQT